MDVINNHPERPWTLDAPMKRQFDDLMLGSIELFCLAAENGGFTAAATLASVTPAAVSGSIQRLRLNVRLFVRTTRQIRLTDAGRAYFEQCRVALNQLVEAEREVCGQQLKPSGLLRISVSTPYGHYRLLPLLPEFRVRTLVDYLLGHRQAAGDAVER